jgi:hypothetical protein
MTRSGPSTGARRTVGAPVAPPDAAHPVSRTADADARRRMLLAAT